LHPSFICTRSAIDNEGNFVSYTSFIDLDTVCPTKILYLHNKPIIELGAYGAFDEFGVMVTDVLKVENKIYLYYAGWQRLGGKTAAYQVMLGLAISEDGGFTFQKVSKGPIIGIDYFDPISIGNVAVLKDTSDWKLYYTSLTEWFINGTKPTYQYEIKFAESADGIFWKKNGKVILGIENESGVATPSIVKLDNYYHMWFGYRRAYDKHKSIGGYNIGYAVSENALDWIRRDETSVLEKSKTGWDSEMICYPSVIRVNNKLYMFYCGNSFGKSGFGVAESELNS
jgi:predicted GH43/DUF377 family glycosyl hydrolase